MEMSLSDTKPVVVIGGGIAGLSTAFWLDRKGIPVQLLEASNRIGGVIETSFENGYLLEHGPSTLQGRTAELLDTVEAAGLSDEMVYANERQNRRFILKDGVPVLLPLGPGSFIGTRLFSLKAKLRLMWEPFVKPSGLDDESVSSFVSRRLGQEFLDFAVAPFVGGIYAADPDKISFKNSFPRLYALEEEYGSLVGGVVKRMFKGSKNKTKKPKPKLFSFKSGMKQLPEALASKLGDKVKIGYNVEKIEFQNAEQGGNSYGITYSKGAESATMNASAIVLAVPATTAARLLGTLSDEKFDSLAEVHYAPMAVVTLAYDKSQISHPLDGFGMLTPPSQPVKFLGSLWTSQFFAGRAPEGKVLLTNFIGGMRHPELIDLEPDELAKLAHTELDKVIGINGEPELTKIFKWKRAIPQYHLGHHHLMERIEKIEDRMPGLFVSGAFRGGVAVEDAVVKGMQTAESVTDFYNNTLNHEGVELNV